MPLVSASALFAGGGEGLAGGRACPNKSVSPAREIEGVSPSADARKKVSVLKSGEVVGLEVGDASLIDGAAGNSSNCLEVSEPLGAVRVIVIVECPNWRGVHVRYRSIQ